ncbi:MAG TPA: MlaD family protein [Terracidiphilus sp.]|nr:MlaD family protein [Terracidiphilus sp.]
MPSRKEIQWSQLRVGTLVLAALAALISLVFLMSGSTGGLFAKKLLLRCYFKNAEGLKEGAVVSLDGVTIGNVRRIRFVPQRNPTPVEVLMEMGTEYKSGLHTDSTAAISQAGVLGDSFVDLDSTRAKGPTPGNDAELIASNSPGLQDVIQASQDSLTNLQGTIAKLDKTLDDINSGKGTVGRLINDPKLADHFEAIVANLETITRTISSGQGTVGKLVTDDTLYNHFNSVADKLDQITTALNAGQGSAGKFLKDETFYNNLNAAVKNTNELVEQINKGHGAMGKLTHDPEFAQKLDDTITHLDGILKSIDTGEGTLGQLVKNRETSDNLNKTLTSTTDLLQAFRANPKKYLTIQLKLF